MKKIVHLAVHLTVQEQSTIDADELAKEISQAIDTANIEGDMPSIEDAGNTLLGWSVTPVATHHITDELRDEVAAALALLRAKGYAVAAFSPADLGSMPVEQMDAFLLKMGQEAAEEHQAAQ